MTRRDLLLGALASPGPGFRFADVTSHAGIDFLHNSGAFGARYLPETLGPGCAFLDYDGDGWQDILLVNGMDWPGHRRSRTTLRLYRNNRDGTFRDVTRAAGLDVEMYGLGAAVGDFDNDGFPDLFVTAVGQNRLFRNTGRGTFQDVTAASGLFGRQAFSTSALWFDYDRDGLLDLFVCNYVKWSPAQDVFCSLDGKQKAYCTPEAYRGSTCWLFRNRGNGKFEDVTAASGIFDSGSKALGAAMLDHDHDGWPDLFVANDTQPNRLFRNRGDGRFEDVAVKAGVAFSEDGRARAGMGVDVGDYDNSGIPGLVVTNFDNEMLGLYRGSRSGIYVDQAPRSEVGRTSRRSLGFGCFFFDADLDGLLDLLVVNGHIDSTVDRLARHTTYQQAPHLFLNRGPAGFRDVAVELGDDFARPQVGRGAAFADFDNDGDLDVLVTANQGRARLFRNDLLNGHRSLRLRLVGTKSNRSAIGATVRIAYNGETVSRTVKSGSSYLSQSELPLTFGMGRRDIVGRTVVHWPSGRVEEYNDLRVGGRYVCTEGKGVAAGL